MSNHKWTETDDLVAFYVYRYGHERIARSKTEIANTLGIRPASFGMRIQNFQAIVSGGGLSNYAKQSARIYKQYKSATEPELRAVVLSAIENARASRGSILPQDKTRL
jgi:hypothetical protein